MASSDLNAYSQYLVRAFQRRNTESNEKISSVNPIVSELSAWYEKVRNAIEYREEEVVLRASIERMLKRRLLLGNGKGVASSLMRELIWARYLPDEAIEEEVTQKIQDSIDFYLELGKKLSNKNFLKKSEINSLMYQLMSAEIEQSLSYQEHETLLANYMFHILRENVKADEENEEERDVQVFIAIRKAYAKDDIAFLRYHLLTQYFGGMGKNDPEKLAEEFPQAFEKIESELNFKRRFKILSFVKKQIPPFLILEDILARNMDNEEIFQNEENLKKEVYETCQKKYKKTVSKVQRAIFRSVIFILLSKVVIGFSVEGVYESLVYGRVEWFSIGLNIIIPTLLMITVGFFIRAPGKNNTEKIYNRIRVLLFSEEPRVGRTISFLEDPQDSTSLMNSVFNALWIMTFLISFGLIVFVLSSLGFNLVSQGIFLFFLAVVSFLAYRIRLTAKEYSLEDSQGVITPLVDFFFMPFARIGRYLTEGVSQINVFIFLIDFAIETPFKVILEFFEQWFFFLHSKREDLG